MSSGIDDVSRFVDTAGELHVDKVEPYSGRLRPLLADFRLFRKWKEICCGSKKHQGFCNTITGSTNLSLRLIDVEKRLIVSGCQGVSFAALSYVWGEGTRPCLTKASQSSLEREGSINEDTVPATIFDALSVTQALGERYLWVDTCCIVQDDEQDKLRYVPYMNDIYGMASVTIIAASGASAEVGLPGVRPGSRSRIQKPFMLNGIRLVETLDPSNNGFLTSYIGETAWNKRSWTFQERLLSRRCLIFTDE